MAGEKSREEVRNLAIQARESLSPREKAQRNRQILDRCLTLVEYQEAKFLFTYCSQGSEVDTRDLIGSSLAHGKRVALPRCIDGERLEVRLIQSLASDCRQGSFGILEPRVEKTSLVKIEALEILFIPGVAFDFHGNRMGYGKGFFDRFLAALKLTQRKIGLAFEAQVYPALRARSHDVKMDVLVTEARVIRW